MSGGFLRFQVQYLCRIHVQRWSDLAAPKRAALPAQAPAHTRPGVGEAIRAALGETGAAPGQALSAMPVEALQAEYVRVVGRTSGSEHRGYLIWKIGEALKGRVPVGPVERTAGEGGKSKTMPVGMGEAQVAALDGAWERLGYKSRNAMIRDAVAALLSARGDQAAAAFA